LRRSLLRAPLLRVPDEEIVFLFALLRTASPGTEPEAMVAANRALYERAATLGGMRNPVGTVRRGRHTRFDPIRPRWGKRARP
jgi:cytokinin dehydrogenase